MRASHGDAPGIAARLLASATLAFAVALAAVPAGAQEVGDALELEIEGQLEAALRAFESVLEQEGNSRRDLATIYEHLAVLRFAAGDEPGARDAFLRMLAVAPTASLPDAAPPEMEPLFEEAVDHWAGRTLHADVEERSIADGEVLLDVTVADDLLAMAGGVVVSSGSTVLDEARGPGPAYELRVPQELLVSESTRIRVRLVDEHGGAIWEGSHELEEPSTAPGPRRQPETGGSLRTQHILAYSLIGAGALALAAGIVLAAYDGRATGEFRTYEGMRQQELYRTAAGGWVLISLGGAAIIGGILWRLLTRSRPAEREAALRVASGTIARW